MEELSLTFTAKIWLYTGKAAWFFVTLPKEEADRIKFYTGTKRRGWGSVRVTARIGETIWKTSIFPDSRSASYLLPIKAEVRKKEKIREGDLVTLQLDASV